MSVNLVISFNVKEEKLQSFKDIMNDVKINLPKVDGCQMVKILNYLEDPLAFTLVEVWDSREIHGTHVDQMVSSGQWKVIVEHLSSAPVSGYFSEV
ncbi:putative quinol monooxygenase [Pseudomonas sp. P9_31]|uniref:putative quinol monooxygenase n=1 Tax=Pseudomonas sp. P9_31 TaxID=3043448 RepID=UPI002A363407|nr:antibiotic biosynthesis monooxygenase [Pseudomonas sp. P9_31]WPN58968.1 antibiotic biosynthesis monooxygenase [Pseudomonas sp. P9_31]